MGEVSSGREMGKTISVFTREQVNGSESALMSISNEMRNEPALALRLINGKITPSSNLMK